MKSNRIRVVPQTVQEPVHTAGHYHAVVVACLCAAVLIVILMAPQWLTNVEARPVEAQPVEAPGMVEGWESTHIPMSRLLRF